MHYPIANDCLRVYIDSHSEPQLVSKLLLQVYVWELNNIIVSTTEYGGIKEAIIVDNDIIISNSNL